MNFFSHAPFIRILPAFIAGVAISFFSCLNDLYIQVSLLFGLLSFFFWINTIPKLQYTFKYVSAILLSAIFFSVGFLIAREKEKGAQIAVNEAAIAMPYALAEVSSIPSHTGKSNRVEVMVRSFMNSSEKHTCALKTYFYYADSLDIQLNVGDLLLMKNKLKVVAAPANPGQFDFRYYSSLKRIHCQYRLKSDEWRVVYKNENFSILNASRILRDQLLLTYKKAGIEGQEYAVISALVLGYDDEIDKELMAAFSASGTLHILSVSGMHVGIVFTILSFLFRKMEGKKGWSIFRLIAMVVIIWFYAMLTGLSPSVIRSAMMFTFILLGKAMNRNSNIYNTLAASIMVIAICFDPLIIFEPGFQLSYLAVAGIAFLYKPIYNWFYIKNKFLNAIWNLTAVSIAAQLATFPVSLYYFHQFPNYFIPANLLIIPVSTVAIFGGLFLLVISPCTWLSVKAGIILKWVIIFQNDLAIFIKDLPFAVTEELYLSFPAMILMYVFILLLVFYFMYRSMQLLKSSVLIVMIYLLVLSFQDIRNSQRKELIVYSNSSLVIEVIKGKFSYLFYPQRDSLKALKLSNDLHVFYQMQKKDRLEFPMQSQNLFNGKYLTFDNFFFQTDTSFKSGITTLIYYKEKEDTKINFHYSGFQAPDKSTYDLKKKFFLKNLN
jgi:competence protein ComEC